MTTRYAVLAPFGKVEAFLSELLLLDGAQHASTVRNRTLRVGAQVVQAHAAELQDRPGTSRPIVVGLVFGNSLNLFAMASQRGRRRLRAEVSGSALPPG